MAERSGRVRFDLETLNVHGDPVPLVQQVLTLGAAAFTISRRGTLLYVPVDSGKSRSLVWVNRQGAEEPIAASPRGYVSARLSPDGTRVALQIIDASHEIWTWDFARARVDAPYVQPSRQLSARCGRLTGGTSSSGRRATRQIAQISFGRRSDGTGKMSG